MGIRIPYTKWGAKEVPPEQNNMTQVLRFTAGSKVSQRAHHICAALSGWLLLPCRTGGGTFWILEDHPNRGPWRSLLLENLPMMNDEDYYYYYYYYYCYYYYYFFHFSFFKRAALF